MISILLFKQILKLFLIIAAGFVLVKTHILKNEDSRPLSFITLYLVSPCAILDAFSIERTSERTEGLVLVFAVSFVIHIILRILTGALGKMGKLSSVEKGSIMYSNAGNMILPIILSLFGQKWVLYCSGYLSVQTIFFWTHLKQLLSGEKKIEIKKVLLNVNLIAIALGIVMYALKLRLPSIPKEAVSNVGAMIGPLSMIITGMSIAQMDYKKVFGSIRVYVMATLRLIILPLCVLPVIVIINNCINIPNRNIIMMIVFLAVCAPGASTVVQMSQIYKNHPDYAAAINVLTNIMCIATMPLLIALYSFIFHI